MTDPAGAIGTAERILALLDQGNFTATYKYAVLLGLMDLCMERASAKGGPPDSVTTRQLAAKIIELYWPHTVPYGQARHAAVLRQNSGGQARIVTLIREFRDRHRSDPWAPIHRARQTDPAGFERLESEIEWKLIEMPLPRLQTIGSTNTGFLYEISWTDRIRKRSVRAYQRGEASAFDNQIRFKPGVGEHLIQLNGLLRPLIHRQWAALVARFNNLEESRLEDFLFGVGRTNLEPVRKPLVDLQDGRCFYCGKGIGRAAEVDHFIPWSRYPDDGLDNLVAADRGCNGKKRDFLAAEQHLARWVERLDDPVMEEVTTAAGWHRMPSATLSVACTIYLRLPSGTPLWELGSRFGRADPDLLRSVLAD